MAFLERALGFTRGVVLPDTDGQPRYAEMRHGDVGDACSSARATTTAPAAAPRRSTPMWTTSIGRSARARDAGAGVRRSPRTRPWGDRAAVVTDPDGYRWVLATFKKLVPFGREPWRTG